MKIAIGAVVLCRLLISEPEMTLVKKDDSSNRNDETIIKNSGASNNNFVSGNNAVNQVMDSQKDVYKAQRSYSMILGTVEDIKQTKSLNQIGNTQKYKYEYEDILIVKTEELEKLVVNASACGLASTLIESEKPAIVAAPVIKAKKKKVKISEKVKNNNNEEEMQVLYIDQAIPEGYEVVEDESIIKQVNEKIKTEDSLAENKSDDDFLKELEEKQVRFDKKKEEKVAQIKEEPIAVKEVIADVKKEEENDDDLDVVRMLEEAKQKQKAINEKEEVKEKIADVKKEEKKTIIKEKIKPTIATKKEAIKEQGRITPDNFEPSGNLMKDVFDIITN